MDRKYVSVLNKAYFVLTVCIMATVLVVYKGNNVTNSTANFPLKGFNTLWQNRHQYTNDALSAVIQNQPTSTSTSEIKELEGYANNDKHVVSSPDINKVSTFVSNVNVNTHTQADSKAIMNENFKDKQTMRLKAYKTLYDSIDRLHQMNFLRPENETCEKRLPSCIVIGVAKCGTRELIDFLRLHPCVEIYSSKSYEMPYFYRGSLYRKGNDWLKKQMHCSFSNQITVMKNAAYFHSIVAPERIYKFNESIKLILLVREPVSRLVSHYRFHESRTPPNKRKPLIDFVFNKSSKSLKTNVKFMRMSIYDTYMELWLKYFNLSQILIIDSENLKHDPPSVLKQVEEFLGLGHYIQPDMFIYNAEKQFYCIRSNLTSTGMACYPDNRGTQDPVPEQYVSPQLIIKLREYFKAPTKRFLELTGKSFDW